MAGADLAEIEDVYRRDFGRFMRVATAIVRDEERAYDVVQDAFAAAIRGRKSYRRESPLPGWIWRIVVNTARKAAVGPRRTPPFTIAPAAVEPDEPTGIRAAVAELPERQRLVLFLRYYADLDYEAIATALGIRTGTVGASLNAAHASLRRGLEEVDRCVTS